LLLRFPGPADFQTLDLEPACDGVLQFRGPRGALKVEVRAR
jgi:hypothetical protein